MTPSDEPLTAFRFEVVLDLDEPIAGLPSPLCDAAFAECDGLEMTMAAKALEVGGVNDRQVQLIGPVTYGQLVLKRGMTSDLQLWAWFANGTKPGSVHTAHGEVTLWQSDGTPAIRFTLTGCLPVRLRAPSLNARDGLVAVEELSMVYQQLSVADAGAVGAGLSFGISGSAGISASAGFSASAGISASAGFGSAAGFSAKGGIG